MKLSKRLPPPPRGTGKLSAGTLLFWLTAGFALLFAGLVAWLAADQHALLKEMEILQTKTLPRSIEQQRLARNLETLRLEGERVLTANTPEERRQALFVVTLITSHPALLENEQARNLAIETELFLKALDAGNAIDTSSRAGWQHLSQRLALAADDISVGGINLAKNEIGIMDTVITIARNKLHIALALVLFFLATLLLVIRQLLLRPLAQIDQALVDLRQTEATSPLPPYLLEEMNSAGHAVNKLQSLLLDYEQTRADLEKLAATDMLTGLHNRRHFMNLAEADLARAQRYGRPISVALADLDHFKQVNDLHGHAAGDMALKVFSDLIRKSSRISDIACRYGGEEFAFIFSETTPQEANQLAERLRASLEAAVIPLPNGEFCRITCSFGIADASTRSLDDVLRLADDALYQAKLTGRNKVILSAASLETVSPPVTPSGQPTP